MERSMGVGLRAKRQMFIPGVCLNERSKYRKVSKWVGEGCCVIGPLSTDGGDSWGRHVCVSNATVPLPKKEWKGKKQQVPLLPVFMPAEISCVKPTAKPFHQRCKKTIILR